MQSIVIQKGSWLGFLPGIPFNDVTIGELDVQIPDADRVMIEKQLRLSGQPVTPDTVRETYISWKRKLKEIP